MIMILSTSTLNGLTQHGHSTMPCQCESIIVVQCTLLKKSWSSHDIIVVNDTDSQIISQKTTNHSTISNV